MGNDELERWAETRRKALDFKYAGTYLRHIQKDGKLIVYVRLPIDGCVHDLDVAEEEKGAYHRADREDAEARYVRDRLGKEQDEFEKEKLRIEFNDHVASANHAGLLALFWEQVQKHYEAGLPIDKFFTQSELIDKMKSTEGKKPVTRKEVELRDAGLACWGIEKQENGKRTRLAICEAYLTTHMIKGKPKYMPSQLAHYISMMKKP